MPKNTFLRKIYKKIRKLYRKTLHAKHTLKYAFSSKYALKKVIRKKYIQFRIAIGIGGIKPYKMPLAILEENTDFIVFNKPAGVLVHPTKHNNPDTRLNGLLWHLKEKENSSSLRRTNDTPPLCHPRVGGDPEQEVAWNLDYFSRQGRIAMTKKNTIDTKDYGLKTKDCSMPGPIQRLDRETSGIVVFALSDEAKSLMGKMMMKKSYEKKYITLVKGKCEKSGKITAPLHKVEIGFRMKVCEEKGKESLTQYELLEYFPNEDVSLLAVQIFTGRMHQIRVHMKHIGHPIVGDIIYGAKKVNEFFLENFGLSRQFLHASELIFDYKEKSFHITAPLSRDLEEVLKQLRKKV